MLFPFRKYLRSSYHIVKNKFRRPNVKDTYKIIHYENMPMQYTEIFKVVKNEAVLTSTHNLCFGAKIRKIGIPLQTPVLLYKSGV